MSSGTKITLSFKKTQEVVKLEGKVKACQKYCLSVWRDTKEYGTKTYFAKAPENNKLKENNSIEEKTGKWYKLAIHGSLKANK